MTTEFVLGTETKELVAISLREDIASGDITSKAVIPGETLGAANFLAKQNLVLCGTGLVEEVCRQVDGRLSCSFLKKDSQELQNGEIFGNLEGPVQSLLSAERVALNFLQRLSGVATLTRTMCEYLKDSNTSLVDTRKTTPAYRVLEKYAVATGGGTNHRHGLYDAFLIKDNHIDATGGDVREAINRCRTFDKEKFLQIEVRDLNELSNALEAKPDSVLLDNMSPEEATEAVSLVRKSNQPSTVVELSGGIGPKNLASYRNCGADRISSGFLTHSAIAVDISLRYQK